MAKMNRLPRLSSHCRDPPTSPIPDMDSVPEQTSSPRTSDQGSARFKASANSVISTAKDDSPAHRLSVLKMRVKRLRKGLRRIRVAGT